MTVIIFMGIIIISLLTLVIFRELKEIRKIERRWYDN